MVQNAAEMTRNNKLYNLAYTTFTLLLFVLSIFMISYVSKKTSTSFRNAIPLLIGLFSFFFSLASRDKKSKILELNSVMVGVIMGLCDFFILMSFSNLLFNNSLCVIFSLVSISLVTVSMILNTFRLDVYSFSIVMLCLVGLSAVLQLELFEVKGAFFMSKTDIEAMILGEYVPHTVGVFIALALRIFSFRMMQTAFIFKNSRVSNTFSLFVITVLSSLVNVKSLKREFYSALDVWIFFLLGIFIFTFVYFRSINYNNESSIKNFPFLTSVILFSFNLLWFVSFLDFVFVKTVVEINLDPAYLKLLLVHCLPLLIIIRSYVSRRSVGNVDEMQNPQNQPRAGFSIII